MNGLSKLGIFFFASIGLFGALTYVYISKFGTLSGTDVLVEIFGLGHKLDVLSNDGKFFYSPSEQPFQFKTFLKTTGVFAAGSKGTYPSTYYGKQIWVRKSFIDDDLFVKQDVNAGKDINADISDKDDVEKAHCKVEKSESEPDEITTSVDEIVKESKSQPA